ncbi:MAG: DUF1223 domain-containing protein [Chthoniobacterales bacterium]
MTSVVAAVRNIVLLSLPLLLPTTSSVLADPIGFSSGEQKVQLLELYTSEGCSSCPPAEMALGKLVNDARLWREFVPVAFHVDYWDRLGWKDSFAQPAWTQRQRAYSESWNTDTVYTPGFVLDGREWHNGASIPASHATAPGVLRISDHGSGLIRVAFEPSKPDSFDVCVARLGFGIKSKVDAGENSGKNLLHDFVVLSFARSSIDTEPRDVQLPPNKADTTRKALVAWVTRRGELTPIQATGGWLP